ncbi:hypothetical protein KHM19_23080 [Leptospira borgpetersenii]|nr:hypothetical protein CLV95_11374 [Leptospira borgpetersenii serovar Javanica]GIM19929.1 hypothetical protein KHM09_23800 [Leptospira borgpetersenii]GIM23125.1 hypothetical protein KHM19_23080 [Leptospira borgpetersenii]GIM26433.1 hypothetical protein KHM25_23580 [Leptospira borgpetersenii]
MSKTEDSLAVFWWEGDGHEERDGIYLYGLWRAEEIRAPRAPFPFELESGHQIEWSRFNNPITNEYWSVITGLPGFNVGPVRKTG